LSAAAWGLDGFLRVGGSGSALRAIAHASTAPAIRDAKVHWEMAGPRKPKQGLHGAPGD